MLNCVGIYTNNKIKYNNVELNFYVFFFNLKNNKMERVNLYFKKK